LASAAPESISHKPIDLILAIKTATKDFNESSNRTAPCDATENLTLVHDATDGAKLFMQWLYAIHMKLANETEFSVKPDNEEIQVYAEDCHQKRILLPLKQNIPPGQGIEVNKSVI
jgi:hypothetical protein